MWWRGWLTLVKSQAGRGRIHDGAASIACLLAVIVAFRQTHDLEWPCESDFYRDMGAAQSVLDGDFGGDPAYLGERAWYPPLVPAIVGLASRITGVALHEAYTTFGVYLNLLAPAAFYLMAVRLYGRAPALLGLIGFLFLGPLELVSWLHATYSPWLWPCNLAQGFFYLAVWLVLGAFETDKRWLAALAGVAAGLTMLAHAAPALILAGVVTCVALHQLVEGFRDRSRRFRPLATAAIIGGVTAVVASPFYGGLALEYGGKIRNAEPLTWIAGELTIESIPALLAREVSLRGLVALVGLVSLFVPKGLARGRTRVALLAWFACTCVGLLYGYASQRLRLPPVMPSWHFYFYLQAFESVAFGLGGAVLAGLLSRGGAWALRGRWFDFQLLHVRLLAVLIASSLLVVLLRWERYADRPDLRDYRRQSFVYEKLPDMELYRWALHNAEPSDVVLAEGGPSFFVAAAGRKVLAVQRLFANPYLAPEERERAQRVMLDSLAEGNFDVFLKYARRYGVRYVAILSGKKKPGWLPGSPLKRVHRARRRPGFDVYAVTASRS
jgi:hypothetical protein